MDNGYPQDITTRWRGVPSHLDAAMQWNDGEPPGIHIEFHYYLQSIIIHFISIQETLISSRIIPIGDLMTLRYDQKTL